MSDDIKSGDMVVRVGGDGVTDQDAPKLGAPIRVDAVKYFLGHPALCFSRYPTPGYVGWNGRFFRKIDAPKTEIAEMIRACRPVREKVPA